MVWTKILSKEVLNVTWKIANIIAVVVLVYVVFWGRSDTDISGITEDIASLRIGLESVEASNQSAINTIEELISSNEQLTIGFDELIDENRRAIDITSEIGKGVGEMESRIREVQDSTLESELIIDGVQQLITTIENRDDFD